MGKTELTRQLALQMGLELLRFDMSGYGASYRIALIGAPPGYVGFVGWSAHRRRHQAPHSVVLVDEIESASEVFNLLLQVMDHGTLDNNGRKTDFHNVIQVMTTNAGAENVSRRSIGFSYGITRQTR